MPQLPASKLFAFVLMPFDSHLDDRYKLGIKAAAANFPDLHAERVDEQIFREGILERIYRQIELADIVIADMSGQNPNVFYEVGYAHAKGKLCILLTSNADDIPFDLKHQRHIVFGTSITKLRDELIKELAWAKDEVEKQRASHIKVTSKKVYANLIKTTYNAKAELTFKIDLENISTDRSVNIQALYFYSTSAWDLYQNEKECPSSDPESELAARGWQKRHFIQSPLPTLSKKAWAQVTFKATKYLAWTHQGDELKDSYQISGRSLLRVITSEGNFDSEISINVTAEEFPF